MGIMGKNFNLPIIPILPSLPKDYFSYSQSVIRSQPLCSRHDTSMPPERSVRREGVD